MDAMKSLRTPFTPVKSHGQKIEDKRKVSDLKASNYALIRIVHKIGRIKLSSCSPGCSFPRLLSTTQDKSMKKIRRRPSSTSDNNETKTPFLGTCSNRLFFVNLFTGAYNPNIEEKTFRGVRYR